MSGKYMYDESEFTEVVEKLQTVEEYLLNSYQELSSLLATIKADAEWQNMGKVESEAFLELITMVHKDISGSDSTEVTAAVPSMLEKLKKQGNTMAGFYQDSTAYNNMMSI